MKLKQVESKIRQQAIDQNTQLWLKQGETKPRKQCPRNCNYVRFAPDGMVYDGASS